MKKELLLPPSASNWVFPIDSLYWALVLLSIVLAFGIFVAIVYLAIRYRRTPENQTGLMVVESKFLEIFWSIIPLFIGFGIFAWGAVVYLQTRVPPSNALEIAVVGKQWMWKVQHPEGRREINELHLPVNRAVVLRMISQDVIHSFYIPAFRIKQDVLPQRYQTMWFQTTQVGTYHLFCAEYCGKDHSEMIGKVHVMSQEAYDTWLMQDKAIAVNKMPIAASVGGPAPSTEVALPATGGAGTPTSGKPEEIGKELFTRLACFGCHMVQGGVGPRLEGQFGKTVELANGRSVKFDENYIRESMLNPGAKIVKGYSALMPSFAGRVSEEDILSLIAYIKTLGSHP